MTLLAMVLVGLGSYAFRAVPLFAFPHLQMSSRVERSLRSAGTAAIAALATGGLLHPRSHADLGASLVAVAVGLVAATRGATLLRVVALALASYGATFLMVAVVLA
jgi:branched-subunit amino acid transport protein